MSGVDYKSYLSYFSKIIDPVAKDYCKEQLGFVYHPNARELIWKKYVAFNEFCKNNYMKNSEKLLDRHKVCACYIYAILDADVLKNVAAIESGRYDDFLANERLALCFGMSLLRALILQETEDLNDDNNKELLRKAFNGEFLFPKANHGDYKNNLLIQLYNTKVNKNYNVLSLAETLYLLEVYNLLKNQIPEDIFKLSN